MLNLSASELDQVKAILEKNVPNRKIIAFGSRVKQSSQKYSDLDLCVMGDEPLSFKESYQLREDFSNSYLPFKVDIVEWASIDEIFREIIHKKHDELTGASLSHT